MNVEDFRDLCLSMPQAKENSPWTEPQYKNLVTFTVAEKWFCLLDPDNKFCDLKCPAGDIAELQEKYMGVESAWHMNKTHWIKVILESDVPDAEIRKLVKRAYDLILESLSKAKRQDLGLA